MKTTLTLLSLGAFVLSANAQPTLTQATNAPVVGDQYSFNYGPHVPQGAAGASQTWDLSALTTDSVVDVELVLPSATPNGAQFPNATVAEVNDVVITYYSIANDGVYFAGSDDSNATIVNTQMGKYLSYPCTFGSTWSAPESAEFISDGIDVYRTGSVTGEADGHGTVIMPWGTVTDVLRVHWTSVLQDSTALFNLDYAYDAYLYYVTGQSYPIAELVTATVTIFGNASSTQFSRWTDGLSLNVIPPLSGDDAVRAFPNPADAEVRITMPEAFKGTVTAVIFDAAGRTIQQETLTNTGALVSIQVATLVPGYYTVQLSDAEGRRAAVRFTKR